MDRYYRLTGSHPGWIECKDHKPVMHINDDFEIDEPNCFKEIRSCIVAHEQAHLDQIKASGINPCEKADDLTLVGPPEELYWEYEIEAYEAEQKCLEKLWREGKITKDCEDYYRKESDLVRRRIRDYRKLEPPSNNPVPPKRDPKLPVIPLPPPSAIIIGIGAGIVPLIPKIPKVISKIPKPKLPSWPRMPIGGFGPIIPILPGVLPEEDDPLFPGKPRMG